MYELSKENRDKLANNFTYHSPVDGQPERYVQIRGIAHNFALQLYELTPGSREQSLALTKLEEVVFWANAAIARNEGDSQDVDAGSEPGAMTVLKKGTIREAAKEAERFERGVIGKSGSGVTLEDMLVKHEDILESGLTLQD